MPEIQFNTFYRYDELTRIVQGYAEEFPQLVHVESIGKSYEGRDIWLVKVTNFETGVDEHKPALWVDGRNGVPKGWKVKGMEVSIKQYPTRRSRPLMGMVEMRKAWEVVLSQYDPSNEDMEEAVDRILRHFPDATVQGFPSSDREYQYARFILPDIEIATQYMRT